MKFLDGSWLGCVLLAMLVPGAAGADTASPVGESRQFSQRSGFSAPVATAALDAQRGGAQQVSSDIRLGGVTAGNSASQVVTGSNDIGAGAFTHMSGLPVVIQNSGANVLIQNAVVLNLQIN